MKKHTKGPWMHERSTIYGKMKNHVEYGPILAENIHKMNIGLISAAPELLEAIEKTINVLTAGGTINAIDLEPPFTRLVFELDLLVRKATRKIK